MPKNDVHCAISKKRTGKTYQKLHSWIDENKDDKSVNHRSKNHYYSAEIKDIISQNFGGAEAVSEWLFHIALDNLDTSVSNDWNYLKINNNFHKFAFEPDGFIHYEEENLEDNEIESEFPDDFE